MFKITQKLKGLTPVSIERPLAFKSKQYIPLISILEFGIHYSLTSELLIYKVAVVAHITKALWQLGRPSHLFLTNYPLLPPAETSVSEVLRRQQLPIQNYFLPIKEIEEPCFSCARVNVTDKMDDVVTVQCEREKFVLAEIFLKKVNFKLQIDEVECVCAGVEAPQHSRSSVFSLCYLLGI